MCMVTSAYLVFLIIRSGLVQVLDLLLALVSASGRAQAMLLGSDPTRCGLVVGASAVPFCL